jgi:hypothetical protein
MEVLGVMLAAALAVVSVFVGNMILNITEYPND